MGLTNTEKAGVEKIGTYWTELWSRVWNVSECAVLICTTIITQRKECGPQQRNPVDEIVNIWKWLDLFDHVKIDTTDITSTSLNPAERLTLVQSLFFRILLEKVNVENC